MHASAHKYATFRRCVRTFGLPTFGDICRSGAAVDEAERKVWERKRKMCRFVIIESGLRLRKNEERICNNKRNPVIDLRLIILTLSLILYFICM
jgi:hypothetical protein